MGILGRVLLVSAAWCFMEQVHSIPYHMNKGLSPFKLSATTPAPLGGAFFECGISKRTEVDKLSIYNGRDAILGDWPWIVGLFYKSPKYPKGKFFCGGSLISNQWILTAAHCVSDFKNASSILVRLGDLNFDNQVMDGASPIEAQVDQLVPHPQFELDDEIKNDIGLIRLKNPVRFSENIHPICLFSGQEYKTNEYYYDKESTLIGWGQTGNPKDKNGSSILQEASINILKLEACKEDPEIGGYFAIDEKIICTGATGGNACHGDSGGPLMFLNDAEERFYLGGITSGGNGNGCTESPGVYTKVAQFICWINEVTKEDF